MNKKAYSFKFDDTAYLQQLIYDIKDNIGLNGSKYIDDDTEISISKDGTSIFVINDNKNINTTINIPNMLAGIMMNLLNSNRDEVIKEFNNAVTAKIEMEQKINDFDNIKSFITLFSYFKEPEHTIYEKMDDLYIVPIIMYQDDESGIYCGTHTIAINDSHLKKWGKTKDEIFEIGWHNFVSSVTFERNSQDQLLFSIQDKNAGITLMTMISHIVYSEEFRNHITQNYHDDIYISFPKAYIGYVWEKDMIKNCMINGDTTVIRDHIYKYNMSAYFDTNERNEDEEKLLYRLYRIPVDIDKEVEVYQF